MSNHALSSDQVNKELKNLPGWSYSDDAINKQFEFGDFRKALAFIVQVGFEAEDVVHHPEMTNVYNRVSIRLTTHDVGDKVTPKDIELAKRIEKLAK